MARLVERSADSKAAPTSYVPERCRRAPNCSLDRAFGIQICHQHDSRCRFYGPVFVQDESGRQYECRAREPV